MFFQELVQQHRVHRFVAHGVDFAFGIASHQIRIDLFYVLSHKAKLRNAIGIKLVLVPKRYRFQRENRFARLAHGFDRVLETHRGGYGAEMTVGIHDDCYASGNSYPTNAGDKCILVSWYLADPNCVGLISNPSVADIDIVSTRGEVSTRMRAECDVEIADGIARERIMADGDIVVAGEVVT